MLSASFRNSITILALLAGADTAFAAESSALAANAFDSTQLAATQTVERVLVTGRRREEDPQEVPISLRGNGSGALDTTSTYRLSHLSALIPSLNDSSPN